MGGVLIFFIPLQMALWGYWLKKALSSNSSSRRVRGEKVKAKQSAVLIGLSLPITCATLLITQSRGAMGGLAVGLVTMAAIRTWWGRVLAILGIITLAVVINLGLAEDLLTSGVETGAAGTIRLAGRLDIWQRALQGLGDFPLTGMGMNTFRQVMPILYPPFLIDPTWDFAHAHNHFLQAGLDLGLPGLVAYLALWLGTVFLLFQVILRADSQFYQAAALGLSGGFSAYFVYGLTDTVALGAKPGFVFWWALGLGVATFSLFYKDKLISHD